MLETPIEQDFSNDTSLKDFLMKETVTSEIISETDIKEAFIVTLAEGKKGSAIFGNEICEELAHHIFSNRKF